MDVYVYLVLAVVQLILGLLLFIDRNVIMAFFPLMGAVLGIFLFLGVGSDGSLTQVSGSSTVTLVSATTSTFSWEAVTLVPIFLGLADFLFVIGRAVRKF